MSLPSWRPPDGVTENTLDILLQGTVRAWPQKLWQLKPCPAYPPPCWPYPCPPPQWQAPPWACSATGQQRGLDVAVASVRVTCTDGQHLVLTWPLRCWGLRLQLGPGPAPGVVPMEGSSWGVSHTPGTPWVPLADGQTIIGISGLCSNFETTKQKDPRAHLGPDPSSPHLWFAHSLLR